MKKLIAISLSLILISLSLVPASASDLAHPFFDWYSTLFGVASGRDDQTYDPDDLVDYYETNTGRFKILYNAMQFSGGNPIVTYVVKKNLDEAVEHRYIATQLKKSQLEAVFNSFEDFWASDSAPVRNLPLSDLGITFAPGVNVHGSFGKIQGSGEAVRINNASHFTYFTYPDNANFANSTVYLYNGSIYFPPVLIVPQPDLAFFNGYSLPIGIYYILNGSVLLFGGDRFLSNYGNQNYVSASVDDDYTCTNFKTIRYGYGSDYYQYYYSSQGKKWYGSSPSYEYSYDDMLNLWSKAIGIHIPLPNDDSYGSLINIPDDVPYDENDETVVMVPVEGSGSPIYMTPNEYNTYVTNGDIYNTDDHSNNVVDNSVVNELTNLYNDYLTSLEPTSDSDSSSGSSGSGFNDGKIRAKIDRVIDKLDEILKAIKSVEPANIVQNIEQNINPDPVYVDFSECITQNIPVAADIKNFVLSLNTNDMDSGFNDFSSILSSGSSKVPNSSGSSNDSSSNDDIYSNLGVNVNWYSPYREPIRNILKVFVWGFGLIAYWHAIRSVFGIQSGGDDL